MLALRVMARAISVASVKAHAINAFNQVRKSGKFLPVFFPFFSIISSTSAPVMP
jgi:hypothetical protein